MTAQENEEKEKEEKEEEDEIKVSWYLINNSMSYSLKYGGTAHNRISDKQIENKKSIAKICRFNFTIIY